MAGHPFCFCVPADDQTPHGRSPGIACHSFHVSYKKTKSKRVVAALSRIALQRPARAPTPLAPGRRPPSPFLSRRGKQKKLVPFSLAPHRPRCRACSPREVRPFAPHASSRAGSAPRAGTPGLCGLLTRRVQGEP
jgi:hypothetical protein